MNTSRPHICFFDTHEFDKEYFTKSPEYSKYNIQFHQTKLNSSTAHLAKNAQIVCAFVNDDLSEGVLCILHEYNVKLIVLRCAGFNKLDIEAAKKLNLKIARVPEYSPYAVAEHTAALLLTLVRKTHKAYNRVREQNFSLDGLVGFDLNKKTVGVIGTGKIGSVFCHIMHGFGCQVFAFDLNQNSELKTLKNLSYANQLDDINKNADIISLHLPLTKSSLHLINEAAFAKMKNHVVILNSSRGKLIDTKALIQALKSKKVLAAGLDVYEEEEEFFYRNHTDDILTDDQLARLMTFPNVLITSHQAFLTKEALSNIAETTYENIAQFLANTPLINEVK